MASIVDVRTSIRSGDANELRRILAQDPALANALIPWGNNDCVRTHPLHYVSDMLFDNTLERGKELPLIDVLLEGGAHVDLPRSHHAHRCACNEAHW